MIRVLIADDHAIVRKGMRQIISEAYPTSHIGEVGDVESLVSEVTKSDWDIVITDINMPGRSGVEALRQLKQINPKLPVLIMSMYPEDQYALRVLKGGAAGYLSKEKVHEELIRAIQAILQGRKFITPGIAEQLADSLDSGNSKELYEILSDREFDVLKMLAKGRSVSEIADQLALSATTVSTYRSRIMEKMQMKTNADLTRYALEKKLI